MMNIKEYFEKHNNRTLKDEEWELLAQTLMTAKFDREKKAEWAERLSELGIQRTPPVAMKIHSFHIRKWMAAASILLILAAAGWYFFLKSPLSQAQQMASQYLDQPFRINQGSTRGEESIEKNRGKAYEAFDMKQYEKALYYLGIIESEKQSKASDYFQMGLCLMYQNTPDYTKAINAFQAAQKMDPIAYSDEINWFTGLCYLMTGDEKTAATFLQKVIDSPSSRNRDAAVELMGKMKN